MSWKSDLFEARRLDVLADLAAEGFSGLAVGAWGSALGVANGSLGFLRYLVDFNPLNSFALLLLKARRRPVLLVQNVFYAARASETLPGVEVLFVPPDQFPAEAASRVRELFARGEPVAVAGKNWMSWPLWAALSGCGPRWGDGEGLLARRRTVKEPWELELHRRGGEICDRMVASLGGLVRSGKPAYQIQAALEHIAKDEGAEYAQTWLTVAPRADRCRFTRDEGLRTPQTGDQVLLGIFLMYEGYWGHELRTGAVGTPDARQVELFETVKAMEDAGFGKLRPGNDLKNAAGAMTDVLERRKRDEWGSLFRFRDGHGLGLDYEEPILTGPFPHDYAPPAQEPESVEVRPGMVFELHPNVFSAAVGGAVIGDMVEITPRGPEFITRSPRELAVW